jgi:hypothetical protein
MAPTPQREVHSSDAPIGFSTEKHKLGDLLPDAIYATANDVLDAYRKHAYDKGYGVVLDYYDKNKKGRKTVYMCDRGGKPRDRKNLDMHASKKRPNAASRKTNCPFRIIAQEQEDGRWKGYIKEEYHNHEASDSPIAHPSNRTKQLDMEKEAKDLVSSLLARKTSVSTIRAELRNKWRIEVTKRDIYNMGQRLRNETLGGKTPIQWLVDELERLKFFVHIDTDENNRVTRLFFAHSECIQLLKKHPDVILIDCTYKTNRFNMPLVNICGSSGNNMTPQFAVAFLSGEKKPDYTWTMECFIELLDRESIPRPKCFVTDRELALLNTLDDLFPKSDHILCRWHVNMNVVAKTKKHFKTQEEFDAFWKDWTAVIEATTLEEYEDKVKELRFHNKTAVKYIEKTWLVWREKIASFKPVY